ncbi:glycosyltransferase family 87 protein [Paraburkholderia youngii]|uniref:glycosyltransferase family 87 protein n=1 Tax=Paraburkholderia youngii TaxID=2782701 RepID=UPI003D1FE129
MFNSGAVRTRSNFGAGAALLLLIAVACLALRILHVVAKFRGDVPDAFGDFNFYLYAFDVVLHDPARLYDHDALIAFLQGIGARSTGDDIFYAYPPQFALVFAPLALLTPLVAKIVWVSASIVLFALALYLVVTMAYRGAERSVSLLLVAVALLSFPLVEDTYDGQSNELLFFLLVATFALIERGKGYAAGLFLGFAIAIKLTPLAVAGLLLLRREWRTFVMASVVAIALTLITGARLGFDVLWHYFVSDMPRLNGMALAMSGGGAPMNNAVRGALQTLSATLGMPMSGTLLSIVSHALVLAACLLSAYLVFRRHRDSRIDYALASMTMLVAYPILEPIHMVLALIPLLILLGTAFEARDGQLSALGPRLEMLLVAVVVVLLFFAARFVSYTVAALIIYLLCVARYFPPSEMGWRERAYQPG